VDKAVAFIRDDKGFKLGILGFQCDCTQVEHLQRVAESVKNSPGFGPVDILICCAGSLKAKTLLDLTEQDVRQSFDVNVISIFWVSFGENFAHMCKDHTWAWGDWGGTGPPRPGI